MKTTNATTENNRLIAEFMELPAIRNKYKENMYSWLDNIKGETLLLPPSKMNFDRSWDWLMPVVEKIERLGDAGTVVCIQDDDCNIGGGTFKTHVSEYSKLKSTYKAVVEFIKWYNKQNDSNEVAIDETK